MLDAVLKSTFNFEKIINQNIQIHNVDIFVTAREAKYQDLQLKDKSKLAVDYKSMKK